MLHLGIDIGGTKMEAVLLDPAGECVQRLRRPTHKESYDAFMRQLLTLIADIRAVSPQPFTLGIGLPGAIDPQSGRIKNCNCLVLNGHDLRRDIMQQLGQPVWMANDADCFTLSEAVDGAGAGATTVFGVIIGTGFARRYGEQARAEAIVAAAQNGDPRALAHWRHFIDAFARSLASVINILDPQVIVLGGGLSNVSQIYRDLPAAIVPWIFSDTCRTQIKPARFGDASGVRGAAWLPRLPGAAQGQR